MVGAAPHPFDVAAAIGSQPRVVKLRLVASLVFLLIAMGLPVAAVSSRGPPWGFRGHEAVVLDVVGTFECEASASRRQRDGIVDGKLEVVPNLHLDVGDEIRVARLSQVRLRFEGSVATVSDGGRIVIGPQRIHLSRGRLVVEVQSNFKPFEIELESGCLIALRSGTTATIIADGKGGARAVVANGSLDVRAKSGETVLGPEKMLIVEGAGVRVIDVPTSLVVTASCSGGTRVNIVAPGQVQIFAAGALLYPDVSIGEVMGSVVVDLDPGTTEVGVFARDVVGHVTHQYASCEKTE